MLKKIEPGDYGFVDYLRHSYSECIPMGRAAGTLRFSAHCVGGVLVKEAVARGLIPNMEGGPVYGFPGVGVVSAAIEVFNPKLDQTSAEYFASDIIELNDADNINRLVFGLLETKVAPTTFYSHASEDEPRFNGIPVDIAAEKICFLVVGDPGIRHTRT